MAGTKGRSGGHNRVPTRTKQLRGTYRKDRANPLEPIPPEGNPKMPRGLSDVAKREWTELVKLLSGMHVLTKADKLALWGACVCYADAKEADKILQAEGLTVMSGPDGDIPKKHPAVAIKADSLRLLKGYLIEFGLTPASRARVEQLPQPKLPSEMERFQARRKGGNWFDHPDMEKGN